MVSMRELVAATDAEFAARGVPLQPGAAREMVRARVVDVAEQAGITPRTALGYFSVDSIRDMARNTCRTLKEHEAAEAALPPVELTMHDVGVVVSTLGVAVRLAVLNGESRLAADLVEVITGVALALRTAAPGMVPAGLLRDGLRWAQEPADKITQGLWKVLPGSTAPQEDAAVAAQLSRDLTSLRSLLAVRAP